MSTPSKPAAIVIGSGVVTLGVINDLSADGIAVAHVSPKSSDIALRSRWPMDKVVLDADGDLTQQVLDALHSKSDSWRGACLIPTNDPMLRVISRNLDTVTDSYVTNVVDWKTLYPIINKALLYEVASQAGIPTPKVLYGFDQSEAEDWAGSVQYPVIVKPSQTPEFFSRFNAKVLQVNSREELKRQLAKITEFGLDVMVSEIIPGQQTDIRTYRSYIDRHGQIIAEMCSEKIRSHPPEYGVGIVQRTIPLEDPLCRQGQALLKALNFRGFASTEFKRDARDGQLKLMEINPRPAMVQRLFRKAGINFARLAIDDAMGKPLTGTYTYRPNIQCIHNTADLYHFRHHAKRGLSGLRDYFAPYLSRRKVFLVPPLRDPVPYLYEMRKIIGARLRKFGTPADVQN